MKRTAICATFLLVVAAITAGCGKKPGKEALPETVAPVQQLTDAELHKIRPNELGKVLILEYHDVSDKEERWARQHNAFRKDLARLYKLGYRPISLRDLMQGNINVPAGKTPVVITFDDGTLGQFNYVNDADPPKVDPNCAVAILEDFHKQHPDWGLAATFYVYYPLPFRQKKDIERKLQYVHSLGMDIGNHTYSHVNLKKLSAAEATKEIALSVKEARKYAPGAVVDTISLPYGLAPKDQSVLKSGSYQGQSYKNIAAVLVGAEPAPSFADRNFKPYRLPRVQAIQSELDKWLGYFTRHPDRRYISDGDPETITVPKALEEQVNKGRLGGRKVRVY